MIVRPAGDAWLLISQVQHARLAAEIARNWHLPDELSGLRECFLFAVAYHDEGWKTWERAPTIDEDGGPRNFMDMPMPVATGIWTDSINVAAKHSPLSGLWVSEHFCHLARLAIEHRQAVSDRNAAARFLARQAAQHQIWRESSGIEDFSPIELAGLHGVQFFDRLSLWLCCEERTADQTFVDPSGKESCWSPESALSIRVTGGLTNSELKLTVPAVQIEHRCYTDNRDLRRAIKRGRRTALSWVLTTQS